jgi:hypothetical protein
MKVLTAITGLMMILKANVFLHNLVGNVAAGGRKVNS